jgi:hypothetical protein
MLKALRSLRIRILATLVCLALFGSLIGSSTAHAQQPAPAGTATSGDLMYHSIKVNKVMFLGNSLTLHGPAPAIGWQGNWGMAASSQDLDYVHRVLKGLAAVAGKEPESFVANVADFERNYETYDLDAGLKKALEFKADLVIIAFGENVPALSSDAAKAAFKASVVKYLKKLDQDNHPVILVRSCFWPDAAKDAMLQEACREVNGIWVEAGFAREESNMARSEHKFSHKGVAAHPGDKGMQAIADAILQALSQRGK